MADRWNFLSVLICYGIVSRYANFVEIHLAHAQNQKYIGISALCVCWKLHTR